MCEMYISAFQLEQYKKWCLPSPLSPDRFLCRFVCLCLSVMCKCLNKIKLFISIPFYIYVCITCDKQCKVVFPLTVPPWMTILKHCVSSFCIYQYWSEQIKIKVINSGSRHMFLFLYFVIDLWSMSFTIHVIT